MKILVTILITIAFQNCIAQNVLSKMEGNWEGQGMLFNQAATFQMKWAPALNGSFIKLIFKNQINGSNQVFLAEAIYRVENENTAIGWWFDIRKYSLNIDATMDQYQLISIWKNETEKGKTVYQLISKDKIAVTDFVWKNEEWVQFGNAEYLKQSPN